MIEIEKLNDLELDVLKEIGNIGAGHAATALSQLIGKKVDMHVPNVKIASFNEVMDFIGGAEQEVVVVYLNVEGDTMFSMFYVLPLEQADYFVQVLLGETASSFSKSTQSEISVSVIAEIGNILTGSYLTALHDFTSLTLVPSVPTVAIDMFGAIISYGLVQISDETDYTIIIDTELFEDESNSRKSLKGHFLLLPQPNSFQVILHSLGVI